MECALWRLDSSLRPRDNESGRRDDYVVHELYCGWLHYTEANHNAVIDEDFERFLQAL